MAEHRELVLASGSPRRRELLARLGLDFAVDAADVDERLHDGEPALHYVERVARAKSAAVVERRGTPVDTVVLAADTTVDLDGEVLAKPADDHDARRMLHLLSGRTHQVHTAVVGWCSNGEHTEIVTTDVTFARLSEAGIGWYLSLGEHHDKAGAYGMQGVGGALVHRIDGSPTNVVGLPLAETIRVLRACGLAVAGG